MKSDHRSKKLEDGRCNCTNCMSVLLLVSRGQNHAVVHSSSLLAVLSEIPRKNSWQVAEQAKQAQPYGMQRLLSSAVWDVDGVRDDLRAYVLEQLGTADAIGVLDESGIPKRGKKSAGVKKQHCGSTGRV